MIRRVGSSIAASAAGSCSGPVPLAGWLLPFAFVVPVAPAVERAAAGRGGEVVGGLCRTGPRPARRTGRPVVPLVSAVADVPVRRRPPLRPVRLHLGRPLRFRPVDGYGADERRYQADRSAAPVEDRYGQSADDLAAAAGRGPVNGRTNGSPSRTNGSGQPTSGTAAENDPAVEAATDEPTRRITRPAVD